MKTWRYAFHADSSQKEEKMPILVPNKIDFKLKRKKKLIQNTMTVRVF